MNNDERTVQLPRPDVWIGMEAYIRENHSNPKSDMDPGVFTYTRARIVGATYVEGEGWGFNYTVVGGLNDLVHQAKHEDVFNAHAIDNRWQAEFQAIVEAQKAASEPQSDKPTPMPKCKKECDKKCEKPCKSK